MLDVRLLAEADRQLTVCNACRYCEGICPVFPALERRKTFLERDIVFLANLCHDCGACFDACPYTPPHELAVDFPAVMADVRLETYRQYAAPRFLSRAFARGSRTAAIVTLSAIAAILTLVTVFRSDRLLESFQGPGAFYEVIPWAVMFGAAMLVSIYGLAVLALGFFRFWRTTDGPFADRIDVSSLWTATGDVLVLRQMRGGGPGCTYPDGQPSHQRVVFHQAVFYGFGLTFLSTVLAAITQEILGILPPYPLLSPIVLAGTIGGILQIVGCAGLLGLKLRVPPTAIRATIRSMDFAFLALLLVANVTGLALLAFRESQAMGLLLVVHLGCVAGLFITMPYGKFVHVIYRYGALVRNRQEERLERQAGQVTTGGT